MEIKGKHLTFQVDFLNAFPSRRLVQICFKLSKIFAPVYRAIEGFGGEEDQEVGWRRAGGRG